MACEPHTSLPVAWSNAARYGPMQVSPLAHPSPFCVRVTSTKTVPTFMVRAAVLRLAFFFLAACARFFLCVCLAFFFLALCLCLVAFFLAAAGSGTSRSPMATDEFTLPPKGSFAFHTSLPVSALTAKTQPRVEAMYMQPSAMTGVPVKSPAPPLATDENVHDVLSVEMSIGEMTFSAGCERELDRSWP